MDFDIHKELELLKAELLIQNGAEQCIQSALSIRRFPIRSKTLFSIHGQLNL